MTTRLPTTRSRIQMPLALAIVQIAALLFCVWAYRATELTFEWRMNSSVPILISSLVAWGLTFRTTKTSVAGAVFLLWTGGAIVLALQYPALALGRPLIDATLRRADESLGISMAGITRWLAAHPTLGRWALFFYATFLVQQFVVLLLLAWKKDRTTMWRFVAQCHVLMATVLITTAIWPASEPWAFIGLNVPYPQTLSVNQIVGFNAGTMHTVIANRMTGLCSFPSLHVAAACLFPWAVRRIRGLNVVVLLLNVGLVLATSVLGIHYVVDVLAGLALGGTVIVAELVWSRRTVAGRLMDVHVTAPVK